MYDESDKNWLQTYIDYKGTIILVPGYTARTAHCFQLWLNVAEGFRTRDYSSKQIC